jgi:hypothetical protein
MMIEGKPELDRLDLFSQRELNDMTREFLREYLRPAWFRSTLVEGLAKEYFPKISFGGPDPENPAANPGAVNPGAANPGAAGSGLAARIAASHPSIQDYFAYVLLDFVLADPSLEEMPAGRALEIAEEMQLTAAFESAYKKELQLSDKKWQQYKKQLQENYAGSRKD